MRIATAEDAEAIVRPLFEGSDERRMAVLHLDRERRLIDVACGGAPAAGAGFPLADIVGSALKLHAEFLIVASSRPGGDASPAPDDLAASRELADAAATVGVRLLDHLICSGGEVRSIAAMGLL